MLERTCSWGMAGRFLLPLLASAVLQASMQVHLATSLPSPQPVGTRIALTASATDNNSGPVTYKFEYAPPRSSVFRILRDFSVNNTFDWVPVISDGVYQLRVTSRDYLAGESAQGVVSYRLNSRVVGNSAVVSPTGNPLVALVSAPPCPTGSSMRVAFKQSGSNTMNYTTYVGCRGTGSMNVYLAGLRPYTTYKVNYELMTAGVVTPGPSWVTFTSGAAPSSTFPARSVITPASSGASTDFQFILTALQDPGPMATDLNGSIVWYYLPEIGGVQLMRPLPGGTFLMNLAGSGTGTGPWGNGSSVIRQQLLREFDLAGNVRRETNADRVSEQLMAMGTDPIGRFNHDAIRLANGYTIALADAQRIYPAGTQGSAVPVNIIGEMIVMLDTNWQVVWYWNSFDHAGGGTQLDINRPPVRGDSCVADPVSGITPRGCPPILLRSPAVDWIHGNSIQLLSGGNLLMSSRNQDWLLKIDFQNGKGSGNILWRMGSGGDLSMNSSDSYPWFSGQHDAAFESGGLQTLSLFDNGNTRVGAYGGNSRGQVLNVDETNRVVSLALNSDLGVYSSALGSAQPLSNGNWMFQPGEIAAGNYSVDQCVETDQYGTVLYRYQVNSTSYRTWRLMDFYSIPLT